MYPFSFGWLNVLGLLFAALLLTPNLLWLAYHKRHHMNNVQQVRPVGPRRQLMETLESIGRAGCLLFLVVFPGRGFSTADALVAVLFCGAALIALYWITWALWAKQQLVWQGFLLCVLPVLLFLLFGFALQNAPLLFFAALFGVAHLYMSGFYIR